MIKAVLIVNNFGKPRLVKFYEYMPVDKQQQIVNQAFAMIVNRPERACNFLDGGSLFGGTDTKIIYRNYATLYFVFVADATESELGILDLIQVFVETLDRCFENVCELDLIFNPDRVWFALDEIIQGGMVLETRMDEIIPALDAQTKIEKDQDPLKLGLKKAFTSITGSGSKAPKNTKRF